MSEEGGEYSNKGERVPRDSGMCKGRRGLVGRTKGSSERPENCTGGRARERSLPSTVCGRGLKRRLGPKKKRKKHSKTWLERSSKEASVQRVKGKFE